MNRLFPGITTCLLTGVIRSENEEKDEFRCAKDLLAGNLLKYLLLLQFFKNIFIDEITGNNISGERICLLQHLVLVKMLV